MMHSRRSCVSAVKSSLAILMSLFAGVPVVANAEPAVYLWGFQRGCERMSEIDRLVEKEMFAQGKKVYAPGLPHLE